MKNQPLDAIIFDHDGTLIDTESPDFEACRMMCQEQNINLPVEYWANTVVGYMNGYHDLYRDLIEPKNNGFTKENMWQRLNELWPITLEKTQLMPGVETLLKNLRSEGYKLGVATASDREWADRWLTRFQLKSYFQVIATGDDIVNNKPDPDVYLYAAEQLGANPQRCLVFEDSVAGVRAAKAAGMMVMAVPTPMTKSLNFNMAHWVVNGLDSVTPAWIDEVVQQLSQEK